MNRLERSAREFPFFQPDPSVRFLGATSLYHFGVASGRSKSLE